MGLATRIATDRKTKEGSKHVKPYLEPSFECTGSGARTRTRLTSQRILSPLRLPIPPSRHLLSQFRVGRARKNRRSEGQNYPFR